MSPVTASPHAPGEIPAPTPPPTPKKARELEECVPFFVLWFPWETLSSLLRNVLICHITAVFSKVRFFCHVLDAIICYQVTHLSLLLLQSSKSKAAKQTKQAKIFTTKSVKSPRGKSGKSGDSSGKSGKALFDESTKGTGWWSATGAVSYINSGSDYTPIGLQRMSSASVMHGVGWVVIMTAVLSSCSFVNW
jgi:hypothetical protein